ncbi:PREDICTED: solute carrier family 35 member F6-like isoform X2 [Priapulus caudatus]|uniref:Solute carrier family 35 member F6-like isoform X2 n=1 Tax=Priapulus caudatus TaxID=37621 RepID=A0ABM1EU09_PRICU|nr:PREDICTED: solute carrier family 35 member F6-like isoform X2 [Priapulus caudatus]
MAWTGYQIFMALLLVTTGTVNTISTKWADKIEAPGKNGHVHLFNHPFLQACFMFIGEFSCMLVYRLFLWCQRRGTGPPPAPTQNFPAIIFFLPALCDMSATSVMYLGLNYTYASSYQMLRGSVIVFTGLLSVAFLRRVLVFYQWSGISFIVCGLLLVGLADILFASVGSAYDTNSIITGDLLIVIAQVFAASQFVLEEKFLYKHNVPPLLAVGWEGLFGFFTLSLLLIPMYFIPAGSLSGNPEGRLEDAIDGLIQISNSWEIALAVLLNLLSIAFFNFAGISVTMEFSATTRMVLDSLRTLLIWAMSLALGWQSFQYLQIIGFILLIMGTFVYNDVIFRPFLKKHCCRGEEHPQSEIEHSNANETSPLISGSQACVPVCANN